MLRTAARWLWVGAAAGLLCAAAPAPLAPGSAAAPAPRSPSAGRGPRGMAAPAPRSPSAGRGPRGMAAPAPAPAPDHAADSQDCVGCHAAEAAEWRASRHAAAWRDPLFQDEFARSRRAAWCVGCHATDAPDPAAVGAGDVRAARGVSCRGCHERGGQLVAARARPGSPHATRVDPAFGTAEVCAGCHEFRFPVLGPGGRLGHYTAEPMQETVSQYRKSPVAGRLGCGDCHQLSRAGHLFAGAHDSAMVARAVSMTLCRAADRRTLVVALGNRGAGHNVPSGGVDRHMALRVWRSTSPEHLWQARLGRRFRPLDSGGKRAITDTTLAPGEVRSYRVPLARLGRSAGAGRGDAGEVDVELRYIYAPDERTPVAGELMSAVIHQRRVRVSGVPRCRAASR